MKIKFTIGDVSKLYQVGQDSLRYYEDKGLIHPDRSENGYRIYGLHDIYRLSTIRDMLNLGFSIEQIKPYLDSQSIDTTLNVLTKQMQHLEFRMSELKKHKQTLNRRLSQIKEASQKSIGEVSVEWVSERNIIAEKVIIESDDAMDLAIKKLHKKRLGDVNILNQVIGAVFDKHSQYGGIDPVFEAVFFVVNYKTDTVLSEGYYASIRFKGSYETSESNLRLLLESIASKGWHVVGDPFEIYEIDNRVTQIEAEFQTCISVRIEL